MILPSHLIVWALIPIKQTVPGGVSALVVVDELVPMVRQWMYESMARYTIRIDVDHVRIFVENPDDALAFRLRWC